MTREEAKRLIDGRKDGSTSSLLDLWEKLGVIKFDDPSLPDSQLRKLLRDTMVEIEWRPFMGATATGSPTVSVRLTDAGVQAIMAQIYSLRLKVVRA